MLNTRQFSVKRSGPLLENTRFEDTKDPCPVHDGKIWHIFGSGGSSRVEKWQILHATSPNFSGPWTEVEPAFVPLENPHVAAPGVVFDKEENKFHMFVQTDFMAVNGTIEHLVSSDGHIFESRGCVLKSITGTNHACIYDPHPALIGGQRYMTYSAALQVGRPDIFLAKSSTNMWSGPWESIGPILTHEQISEHHNQHSHPDYEWGVEGSQLVELPNGKILLNAVCFLPFGKRGTRQRVFFAIAEKINGPYKSLGPVLEPNRDSKWERNGENGHATAIIDNNELHLFYQARPYATDNDFWRYGIATFDVSEIIKVES
ncbi:MAG: hypothetical protein U0525_03455 [Patescibacteria group bacterium]